MGEEDDCGVIDRVPFVIQESGCWQFERDLFFRDEHGTAIEVLADYVTIDFQSHTLAGPDSVTATARGIAALNRKGIKILGGSIEGFFGAVWIEDPKDVGGSHLVQLLNINGSTFRAIRVEGSYSTVRENVIQNIGGTEVFEDAFSMGVEIYGNQCVVSANLVSAIYGQGVGEGVGISLSDARDGCQVVSNILVGTGERFSSYGIWTSGRDEDSEIAGNFISAWLYPVAPDVKGSTGVSVFDNVFRDNLCGANSIPSYLGWLSEANLVRQSNLECPTLIRKVQGIADEKPSDPRVLFLLGDAQRRCFDEPQPGPESCSELKVAGWKNIRLAGELGLAEAERVYLRALESGLLP